MKTGTNLENFFLKVSMGIVPNWKAVVIRGHVSGVNVVDGDHLMWHGGTSLRALPSSAEVMNISSNNANDTSAGSGMRSVLVKGLNSSYEEIEEIVQMNGLSNVATSLSYIRVNSMVGYSAGATEYNEGTIRCVGSVSGLELDAMEPGDSVSATGGYTIPIGYRAYFIRAEFNASKLSGGSLPVVEFKAEAKQNKLSPDAPWLQLLDKKLDTNDSNYLVVDNPVFSAFPEKTEARFLVKTDTNGTDARARVYLLLQKVA